jgi:branched-chain amino acid transport system permease protein
MVGAIGINVSWVFAAVFVIGCYLAGLGGALVAPTQNITQGMDHAIIIEAFLIVIIGGLGNIWGALLGALIFGLTDSIGILIWPQFAIVFPYVAVVTVLLFRPRRSCFFRPSSLQGTAQIDMVERGYRYPCRANSPDFVQKTKNSKP